METVQPFANVLIANLFPVIASIVLALLPVLLEAFRRYLKAKYNFEVDQTVIDRYREFAIDGLHWAEEEAAKLKKDGKDVPDSAKKMDMALKFVVESAKFAKLPERAEEEIKRLIESSLNQERG